MSIHRRRREGKRETHKFDAYRLVVDDYYIQSLTKKDAWIDEQTGTENHIQETFELNKEFCVIIIFSVRDEILH